MQKNDSASVTKDANRTYRKMTEEAVAPLVVKLGVPTMLSMLVTALYSTASTYYVSYLGTSAVGAMGVVFALQTIIQAIGIMIGQGCAAQTSRLLGARDYPKANTLASSGESIVHGGLTAVRVSCQSDSHTLSSLDYSFPQFG